MSKHFLQAAGAVCLLLWLSTCVTAAKPNLLILHTDEHHFNTLGCYGGTIVETPNIDFLAAGGVRCASFYATTPVCSPSRAALVSGRYPQNTPVVTNNIPLDDEIVTFAAVLADQGYATGYAGKWHLDGHGKPQWAPERKFGFDDNRFMFNRGHWKQFTDTPDGPAIAARNANGKPTYALQGADAESFSTDWLADKTIEFVEAHADEPFCYMVSFPDPHGPNSVRPPYDTMYEGVEVPIPSTLRREPEEIPAWGRPKPGLNEANLRRMMPQYYAMVKCIDDNVGRVLDCLREEGLLDTTIVVFTADHGDLCGEHGRTDKGVPYEGSARIPMIVYYPARIEGGTVVDASLGCVDFMPTILSLMGVEPPETVQGRDASRLLTEGGSTRWDDATFLRGTRDWLCVVTDDHKLVFSQNEGPWLFDLSLDPEERVNRFGDPAYRTIVEDLTRRLQTYCVRYGDPYGTTGRIAEEVAAVLADHAE